MATIVSAQKGVADLSSPSDLVAERYHEFTRRIPKAEMGAIEEKMAHIKPKDLKDFILEVRAPRDLAGLSELIGDIDAPYRALYALREGSLSVGEVATICRLHFALKHEGARLKSVAQDRDYAERMVLTSGAFAREAREKGEHGIEVPESRIDDYLDLVIRETSVIDGCFVVFPDDQPIPEMFNGVVTRKPTISQRIYQVGLSLLGFSDELEEQPLRIAASFGMMTLAVGTLTPHPCLPNPVLGLSTLEDIRLGQDLGLRDMVIPFPGVLIPQEADGFKADDMGFTYHDFAHALAASHIVDSHRKAYMEISRLLEAEGEGSSLVEAFADIDFPFYAKLRSLAPVVTEENDAIAFWKTVFHEVHHDVELKLNQFEPKKIFSIVKEVAGEDLLPGLTSIKELYQKSLQKAEKQGKMERAEELRLRLSWIPS